MARPLRRKFFPSWERTALIDRFVKVAPQHALATAQALRTVLGETTSVYYHETARRDLLALPVEK